MLESNAARDNRQPQDYAEAMRWFRKAADQGNANAQNSIGWLYRNGWGVAQDYAEALRWFRKAADQGNADAQDNIGDLYYYGHGVAQNYAVSGRAIVSFDVLVDARRPIGTLAASAGQPNRPR